jgi:formate hydrogenlyase subunit 3/multisubunit Na+/H+ antiporter MnhD subunit
MADGEDARGLKRASVEARLAASLPSALFLAALFAITIPRSTFGLLGARGIWQVWLMALAGLAAIYGAIAALATDGNRQTPSTG